MKILSLFTHPQVVANLYEFLSSAEHKGRYREERLEVNGAKQLFGSQSFFKISSFVFSRRKKLIQVYNNLRVSK